MLKGIMDSTTKVLAAIAVGIIAIAAGAGIFLAREAKTSEGGTGYKSQEEITIRYLSASTIVEPYEFARELGYLKGINITRVGSSGSTGW